eukprot:Skav222337  [mRNA]  locus=scaffold1982:51626:52276:- [translate_table: standard]
MEAMDVQLALRGKTFPRVTVKPLFANPAGPRPPKRDAGFNRQGPCGLVRTGSRGSMTKAPERKPPPPPPKVPPTQPLMMPPLPFPPFPPVPPGLFGIPPLLVATPKVVGPTPSVVPEPDPVEPGTVSSPEEDADADMPQDDLVHSGTRAKAKAAPPTEDISWRVTWLSMYIFLRTKKSCGLSGHGFLFLGMYNMIYCPLLWQLRLEVLAQQISWRR